MSNQTLSTETDFDPFYISQESMNIFLISVEIFLLGLFSLVAVVSNIINMVIFLKLKLRDSVTVGLFALSVTDFSITTLELTISSINMAIIICPFNALDLYTWVYIPIAWAGYAGFLISCWITAMISLERCLCVVFPFIVKQIFTRDRWVFVIVLIYIIIIADFLPIFIVEKMEWVPLDSQCNNISVNLVKQTCLPTAVFTKAFVEVQAALDITAGIFLSISSQLLLFICSLCMTVSLRISSTVRSRRLTTNEKGIKTFGTKSRLTRQKKKLIKLVLYLSVVQTVCNIPRLTVTIFFHSYTGLDVDEHRNFRNIIWTSAVFFTNVTFSCNSFGYYFLNSAYRRTFRKMFCLQDDEK